VTTAGLGALHMADKGFSAGWRLGRHVLGSNYFHHVRDSWGSYAEYSEDIDYIPANCDWQTEDNPLRIPPICGGRCPRATLPSTTKLPLTRNYK
jgi:hypothetical protein